MHHPLYNKWGYRVKNCHNCKYGRLVFSTFGDYVACDNVLVPGFEAKQQEEKEEAKCDRWE